MLRARSLLNCDNFEMRALEFLQELQDTSHSTESKDALFAPVEARASRLSAAQVPSVILDADKIVLSKGITRISGRVGAELGTPDG
jgi:hypothetical protein